MLKRVRCIKPYYFTYGCIAKPGDVFPYKRDEEEDEHGCHHTIRFLGTGCVLSLQDEAFAEHFEVVEAPC
jgi:hypothetical protein